MSPKLNASSFPVPAVLREHQQQAVVDLDGPVDLLDELLAPLHVFRSEPDPQLFATHLRVQSPSELIVPAAVADEARLVLRRLHRPDEQRQVGDEILRHAARALLLVELTAGTLSSSVSTFCLPRITG